LGVAGGRSTFLRLWTAGPIRTPLFGRRRGPLHLPRLWTAGPSVIRGFHPFGFYQKPTKQTVLGAPRSTPATRGFHPFGFYQKPTKHTMLSAPRSTPATRVLPAGWVALGAASSNLQRTPGPSGTPLYGRRRGPTHPICSARPAPAGRPSMGVAGGRPRAV
jgi:hypothetical protein